MIITLYRLGLVPSLAVLIIHVRTPENAYKYHIRKSKIFIRTIFVIFYPEKGYGVRFGQFLSGRRIWHNYIYIFSLLFKKKASSELDIAHFLFNRIKLILL